MTAGDRHSSNTNDRGSAEQRRKRKNWILEVWAADVDVASAQEVEDLDSAMLEEIFLARADINVAMFDARLDIETGLFIIPKGLGRPACRCFRCGKLLTFETMEVDKIVPKAEKTKRYPNGGTYVRENIRPVCPGCNSAIEGEARKRRNAKRKKRNEQQRARRATAKVREEQQFIDVTGAPPPGPSMWDGWAGE